MNKVLIIGAGDELSLRSTRLLAMLSEHYPEIEVEHMNIKDKQIIGDNWEIIAVDEFSQIVGHPSQLHPTIIAECPVMISTIKKKPYYRQGERW